MPRVRRPTDSQPRRCRVVDWRIHTAGYDLNAVMCIVCGNTSFYPAHPEIVIPKVQQAAADRQAAEQKRLQKEWEKQQKRQGR